MSIRTESKSQSLKLNGISSGNFVPDWSPMHRNFISDCLYYNCCIAGGEENVLGPSKGVRQISSAQVIHVAEILPYMMVSSYQTQAGKRPRPGKARKESKTDASVSSVGILSVRMGEGLVEKAAHYSEFPHYCPEEFKSFQHWL